MKSVSFFKVGFFDLVVKEPFVNLNPSEASFVYSFVFHLFTEFSVVFVKNLNQYGYLIISLASSIVLNAILLFEVLTTAFAGDLEGLAVLIRRFIIILT